MKTHDKYANIKRRVRELKKLEIKIRFGGLQQYARNMVWDTFFNLHEPPSSNAKHTLPALLIMTRDEYKAVIDEFFAKVYYEFYKENGITGTKSYDPAVLAHLGLPHTADKKDIKKKFRELAKEYHPDSGGCSKKFIKLMNIYKKLI